MERHRNEGVFRQNKIFEARSEQADESIKLILTEKLKKTSRQFPTAILLERISKEGGFIFYCRVSRHTILVGMLLCASIRLCCLLGLPPPLI